MASRKTVIPRLARIVVDTRDASRDRFIPAETARAMYEQNFLSWDLTNRAYCVHNNGVVPKWLTAIS